MCNRNRVRIVSKWWGLEQQVRLYISDGTIQDLQGIRDAGGGVVALAAGLKEAGVAGFAALGGPLTLFTAGIIAIYFGWIQVANNGCGVFITARFIPGCPPCSTPTVSPQ